MAVSQGIRKSVRVYASRSGLISIGITLFLLPFPSSWARYTAGLTMVAGLVLWSENFSYYFNLLKKNWFRVLPFLLFFFVCFLWDISDTNGTTASGRRILFVLLPLFLLPVAASLTDVISLRFLGISFIAGLTSALALLSVRYILILTGYLQPDTVPAYALGASEASRFVLAFSWFMHPSYFALYLNAAVVVLLIFGNSLSLPGQLRSIFIAIFSAAIFFLSSRTGIIALIATALTYFLLYIVSARIRIILIVGIVSVLVTVGIFIMINYSRLNAEERAGGEMPVIEKGMKGLLSDPRLNLWESALSLIKEKPVAGYGHNMAAEKLKSEFRKRGYYSEAFFSLNVHNQFLETLLTGGIAGFLFLCWMLISPLIRLRNRNRLLFAAVITVLLTVHFIFESMLERQWGIILFLLYSSIVSFSFPDTVTSLSSESG